MERPMVTATERLQFAIRFAQMNLDNLRPGDWINLRDDLTIFLGCKSGQSDTIEAKGGIVTRVSEGHRPQEFPEADFRLLQMEVGKILNSLVHDGIASMDFYYLHAGYCLINSYRTAFRVLMAIGTTRDMTLLTIFSLLNQERLDRIRRCPECGAIFYRIQKQQYCSRVCTNRANVRNWRQREGIRQDEREKAHARYVKKKNGEKEQGMFKIGRRPRMRKADDTETPRQA